MNMFLSVCKAFKTIYVCIDALDECSDAKHLLRHIKDMPPSVRIFTMGRMHTTKAVEHHFREVPTILIEASEDDVQAFVKSEISNNQVHEPNIMDGKLEEEICSGIIRISLGMFLLPALHIYIVLEARTKSKRQHTLKNLPPNLDQAFGSTIKRIENQYDGLKDQTFRILQWIHLAEHPLTVDELIYALTTEVGQKELDYEHFPSRSTFLDCCLGLVIIDNETSTVRFVHYSLREYLNSQNQFPQFRDRRGHESITKTCVTYLSFETNRASSVTQRTTEDNQLGMQGPLWKLYLPFLDTQLAIGVDMPSKAKTSRMKQLA